MTAPVRIAGGIPLAEALAEELGLASRMLADLAYDLGSDDATLRRHMASLQKIDHITQMQLIIADLLRIRNDDGGDPLAAVTLEDMAQRMRAATGVARGDRPLSKPNESGPAQAWRSA